MSNSHNQSIWSYLYIVWIGVVCVILLILNFELVRLAWQGVPFLANEVRVQQMVQFFLPIILIFLEFRIYDFLIDRSDRADELSSMQNGVRR